MALVCLLALVSCSRHAPTDAVRTAVLRFENLGANPADDWIGRAFADVLAETLAADMSLRVIPVGRVQASNQALGARPISAPGISAGRSPAVAAGATRLVYGEYTVRGDRLQATMTVEDAQTGNIVGTVSAAGSANDVLPVAAMLASGLSTHAGKYPTQNAAALRGWIEAQESGDAAAVEADLQRAIAADPGFGAPYRALAEIRVRRGDTPGAIALLESAIARGQALPAPERVRMEAELAGLRKDPAASERALSELAKLTPGDPAVWRSRITTALAAHDYGKSVELLHGLAEIEPDNPGTWKQLGYTAAWAGDLNGAMDALRRYQSLKPADADPVDCQGDVNLILGHLKEAEELYLEAYKKDPNYFASADLFKAAYARLLTGDLAGADGVFARYAAARTAAKDPLLPYRQAEWDWTAGRRKQATARMEETAAANASGTLREISSRGYAQLAVWYVMSGDRAAAARMGDRAMGTSTQASAASAYFARFLAQPEAPPAEWEARAERVFQNPALAHLKQFAIASALLMQKQFEAATPAVRKLEEAGSLANDSTVPVIRAWTLVETGHAKEAAAFLKWNPLPQPAGFGILWTFAFPRIFYLRGAVAAAEGRADEAREQQRLFSVLSGDNGLIWEAGGGGRK